MGKTCKNKWVKAVIYLTQRVCLMFMQNVD